MELSQVGEVRLGAKALEVGHVYDSVLLRCYTQPLVDSVEHVLR